MAPSWTGAAPKSIARNRPGRDDRSMSRVYVALGDSMSIDAYAGGPGRGAASLLHRNRDADFPGWSGKDLAGAGFTAQMLAFDGATSADVVREQLPAITGVPDLVTITM